MQTPFSQGLGVQRSTLSWHRFPLNPGGQSHLKSSIKSVQLAPSKHGFSAQSSVIIERLN